MGVQASAGECVGRPWGHQTAQPLPPNTLSRALRQTSWGPQGLTASTLGITG